jgi:hypothetical protein
MYAQAEDCAYWQERPQMPTQPEERRQLAALMDERRLELGMRWQEVADAGGVSLRALNNARTGDREIRPLTRHGIEKGLRWEPGSIQRILSGSREMPGDRNRRAPAPAPADEDEALRQIMEDERLPIETRRAFVALAKAMRARNEADGNGEGRSA